LVKLKVNILIYAYILLRYLSMPQLAENLFAPLSTMRDKIIHLIQKTEQTIDHLKFMFSPMPTSEGFMDSLQVDMVEREWAWMEASLVNFSFFLKKYYLPNIKLMFNNSRSDRIWARMLGQYDDDYIAPYWEPNKLDIKRTIARMSRNGGIR